VTVLAYDEVLDRHVVIKRPLGAGSRLRRLIRCCFQLVRRWRPLKTAMTPSRQQGAPHRPNHYASVQCPTGPSRVRSATAFFRGRDVLHDLDDLVAFLQESCCRRLFSRHRSPIQRSSRRRLRSLHRSTGRARMSQDESKGSRLPFPAPRRKTPPYPPLREGGYHTVVLERKRPGLRGSDDGMRWLRLTRYSGSCIRAEPGLCTSPRRGSQRFGTL
jgi:hypothetical protein